MFVHTEPPEPFENFDAYPYKFRGVNKAKILKGAVWTAKCQLKFFSRLVNAVALELTYYSSGIEI